MHITLDTVEYVYIIDCQQSLYGLIDIISGHQK